jgi:hypothetical protein
MCPASASVRAGCSCSNIIWMSRVLIAVMHGRVTDGEPLAPDLLRRLGGRDSWQPTRSVLENVMTQRIRARSACPTGCCGPEKIKYFVVGTVQFDYDREPVTLTTLDVRCGAIGLDCNGDHLAVTQTDAFGNLLRWPNLFRARNAYPCSGVRQSVTPSLQEKAKIRV